MVIRWILMIGMVFALTGCFQEAGESLQSTSSTLAPPDQQTVPDIEDDPAVETTPTEAAPQNNDEPTGIPLTIIAEPTDAPIQPQPDTPTPLPGSIDSSPTPAQFITPVSPLLPPSEATTPLPILETTATPSGLITPTAFLNTSGDSTGSAECTYTVQGGDNLYRIAINNGTTVEQMRNANPTLTGENPVLQIGQRLILPNCAGSDQPQAQATAAPQQPQPTASSGQQTYTVQPGDTLFLIARRFNTTIQALQQANQLPNPDRLSVGQVLNIP